jgi:cytochrome c oxidase subunit II
MGLLATACTGPRLGMPTPITLQAQKSINLYEGSFWAAAAVGAFMLVLILYTVFRFRRRPGDEAPPQVHYNVPIEVIYTVVPMVIISVLFYFTAKDESFQDKLSPNPDVTINVVGFQWDWQFNYPQAGVSVTGRPGDLPTMVVPVGKTIRFIETSPDVLHSFWVPNFLFKRDVIPGRTNQFEVTVTKPGQYIGRCTELCGVYHALMLFNVRAVSWPQYQAWLVAVRARAQTGADPMYTLINSSTAITPSGSH